jgi:DNA-directed RNA polymerase specialized sigma24 family protein
MFQESLVFFPPRVCKTAYVVRVTREASSPPVVPQTNMIKTGHDMPELERPRFDEDAVRTAFTQYRGGDDEAGNELLALLFKVRNGWTKTLQWYKGVSWDLAHDAVLDAILFVHEKARDRRKSRFYLPRQGLSRFMYGLVRQRLWALRRTARSTKEKRRDKVARRGNAANPFLPRIVHARKSLAARPAPVFAHEGFEGIALKAFLKFSKRKRAMALAHFEGIPYREIAWMTGTSERAARVHVSKLLSALRKSLRAKTFSGARRKVGGESAS